MRQQEHHFNPVGPISPKYRMLIITIIITVMVSMRTQDPIGNVFLVEFTVMYF